jgi:hypothetical protein
MEMIFIICFYIKIIKKYIYIKKNINLRTKKQRTGQPHFDPSLRLVGVQTSYCPSMIVLWFQKWWRHLSDNDKIAGFYAKQKTILDN